MNDSRSDLLAQPVDLTYFRNQFAMLSRSAAADGHAQHTLSTALAQITALMDLVEARDAAYHRRLEQWQDTRADLEQAAQEARLYFAHAPLPYLITSLDGTIRQANEAAIALLHTDEAHLVGRPLALFVPDGQRRVFRDRMQQATSNQETQSWVLRLRVQSGTYTSVIAAVCVVRGRLQKPQSLRWQFVTYTPE